MLKNRCYNCHRVFFDVFQRFISTSFVLITKEPFKATEQDFFTEQTLLNLLMSASSVKGLKAISRFYVVTGYVNMFIHQ